jgi:hypothetical protein
VAERGLRASFVCGDLSQCPPYVTYDSSHVTTRLRPSLAGWLDGGGATGTFSLLAPSAMCYIVTGVQGLVEAEHIRQ